MKKLSILFFMVLLLGLLAACGNDESETNGSDSAKADEQENKEEESVKDEAEAAVNKVAYFKWLDESVNTETITVYAEVENTGEVDATLGNAKITFLDSNDDVISTRSDVNITPDHLKKGSKGYVATEIEDGVEKFNDLEEVDLEISPDPSQNDFVEFKTKDTKMNSDKWGEESAEISVTGYLENDSDMDFDEEETTMMMGVYDEDDEFIAAETMYMDQQFSLDANDDTSFEVGGGSPLPPKVGKDADHAEVKAIGIQNDF